MMKKIICATLLAASGLTAHATPQSFSFTYTGFNVARYEDWWMESPPIVFQADAAISGQFTGDDLNHDGVLRTDEVSSMKVGSIDYRGSTGGALWDFSYRPGGVLSFKLYDGWTEGDGWVGAGEELYTGNFYGKYIVSYGRQEGQLLKWTPQTTLSVSPVPEPETYAMMLLGLLGVAGLRRRSRR